MVLGIFSFVLWIQNLLKSKAQKPDSDLVFIIFIYLHLSYQTKSDCGFYADPDLIKKTGSGSATLVFRIWRLGYWRREWGARVYPHLCYSLHQVGLFLSSISLSLSLSALSRHISLFTIFLSHSILYPPSLSSVRLFVFMYLSLSLHEGQYDVEIYQNKVNKFAIFFCFNNFLILLLFFFQRFWIGLQNSG